MGCSSDSQSRRGRTQGAAATAACPFHRPPPPPRTCTPAIFVPLAVFRQGIPPIIFWRAARRRLLPAAPAPLPARPPLNRWPRRPPVPPLISGCSVRRGPRKVCWFRCCTSAVVMSGFSIRCSFSHARFPSDRRGAMRPPCPVCCGCWYRIVASAGVALYTVMVKRALQPTFCDSPRAFFPVRPCLPAAPAFALASAIASGVVWSSGPKAHWYVVLCSTAALHDGCPARLLLTTANAAPPARCCSPARKEEISAAAMTPMYEPPSCATHCTPLSKDRCSACPALSPLDGPAA